MGTRGRRDGRGERRERRPEAELAYGVHPVLEALACLPESPGEAFELILSATRNDEHTAQARELAHGRGIAVRELANGKLDELTGGGRHQGFVLQFGPFPYVELEEVLDRLDEPGQADEPERPARILVLDQLQDPRNLGALLRSAAAFAYDAVVVPRDRSAPVSAAAIKVSAGGAWRVPVAQVTNIARALEVLRERGFWIYGAALEGAQDAGAIAWASRTALVLGTEERGLRRLVRTYCDLLVRIPQSAAIESLNVSVAGGILMFLTQQLRSAQ